MLKVSTNTQLAEHMADLIDVDTGAIVRGEASVDQVGETLLESMIAVASGEVLTKAEMLGQNDFIPWRRGVSL